MISCKMITYGRVEFLEESLQSFLNQDYDGEKELVIVNDYPQQKLIFDHPEVRIFNLDYTFETIGQKENFAVEQCKGDIIAVWDDDDVALPNHLSNIKKYFIEGSDLLHWHKGVLFNVPNIEAITGLGNSGIVYSRKAWEAIGRHPLENAGYDMTFVIKIKTMFPNNIIFAEPNDDEVSWFYIWGGRGYHMSGMGSDNDDSKPSVIVRHFEHIESLRMQGKIPTGDIYLNPNWKYDYNQLLKNFINK
jgi:glycosyltransferase involved in cell wall biosynthesis